MQKLLFCVTSTLPELRLMLEPHPSDELEEVLLPLLRKPSRRRTTVLRKASIRAADGLDTESLRETATAERTDATKA